MHELLFEMRWDVSIFRFSVLSTISDSSIHFISFELEIAIDNQ